MKRCSREMAEGEGRKTEDVVRLLRRRRDVVEEVEVEVEWRCLLVAAAFGVAVSLSPVLCPSDSPSVRHG